MGQAEEIQQRQEYQKRERQGQVLSTRPARGDQYTQAHIQMVETMTISPLTPPLIPQVESTIFRDCTMVRDNFNIQMISPLRFELDSMSHKCENSQDNHNTRIECTKRPALSTSGMENIISIAPSDNDKEAAIAPSDIGEEAAVDPIRNITGDNDYTEQHPLISIDLESVAGSLISMNNIIRENSLNCNMSDPIINLSKHTLTEPEKQILSKGLTFVPTTQPNSFNVKLELQRFFRKIRLKYHFRNRDYHPIQAATRFKPQSTFTPAAHMMSQRILAYEQVVLKETVELLNTHKYTKYNISRDERLALQSLSSNKTIVIKSADKGGAIVIQDTSDYVTQIKKQLRILENYKPIGRNPTLEIKLCIEELTKRGLDSGFFKSIGIRISKQ